MKIEELAIHIATISILIYLIMATHEVMKQLNTLKQKEEIKKIRKKKETKLVSNVNDLPFKN